MKSTRDKIIEQSITFCNNPSNEKSIAAEEEIDSIMRKKNESSSSVSKEHDLDLITGGTHNLEKELM